MNKHWQVLHDQAKQHSFPPVCDGLPLGLFLSGQVHDDADPGVHGVGPAARGCRAHRRAAGSRPALLDGRRRRHAGLLYLPHQVLHEIQVRIAGLPAGKGKSQYLFESIQQKGYTFLKVMEKDPIFSHP